MLDVQREFHTSAHFDMNIKRSISSDSGNKGDGATTIFHFGGGVFRVMCSADSVSH